MPVDVEDSNVLEILVGATHPRLIECLLDMMDSNPDARSMLAREYEKEWPERACGKVFSRTIPGKRGGDIGEHANSDHGK